MALQLPPTQTALGSTTYPHRRYHGVLTEVRYAHPDGDNTKDGLTWGTAKATILAAYDALPSTGGDVRFAGSTPVGGEVVDQGLWIVGTSSSDYASPPMGWRQQKNGPVRFIGQPVSTTRNVAVAEMIAGAKFDRAKPAIWVQGSNKELEFHNVWTRASAISVRLGINAAQSSRNVSTAHVRFDQCVFAPEANQPTSGPTIDMGYCFWTYFSRCHVGNGHGPRTITACSTSANIATFTTSIDHNLAASDYVFVQDVTPSAYNGGWQVLAVPTSTTFTVDLGSTPSAGSAFGHVHHLRSDRAAAILADGRGGSSPGPIGYNTTVDGYGIRYYRGNTSWGLIWQETIAEGDFVHPIGPVVEIMNGDSFGTVVLRDLSRADVGTASGAEGHVVEINAATTPNVVVAYNVTDVGGPATVLGGLYRPHLHADSITHEGGVGFDGTRVHGQHDAARRLFPPVSARYANIAQTDTTAWSGLGGAAVVTTGKAAPDGTTGAAELSSASGEQFRTVADTGGITLAVGDRVFGGVWTRLPSAGSNSRIVLISTPHSNNLLDVTGTSSMQPGSPAGFIGGEWEWLSVYGKFIQVGTPSSQVTLSLFCNATFPTEFYAPVMFRLTAGTLNDHEAADFARQLASYPNTVPAGAVSTQRNQKLIIWGGLGVGNSAAATTPGSVVKKMEVFSETGASLGFVPIYSSIT